MLESATVLQGGMRTQGIAKHSSSSHPLVSIITAVFNGEQFLSQTIQSIVTQTYPNIEYIIIDGGSTDGTLSILSKYENQIDLWISETDHGISDAFNKGIRLAQGDYLMFQGDGDGFVAPDSLAQLMEGVDAHKDFFVCARIQRVSLQGDILYLSPPLTHFSKYSLLLRMSLPHQGLLTHRTLFEKHGLFDERYKFSMDYEHILRTYKTFPGVLCKNLVVSKWRCDGVGNNRTLEVLREYDLIKRENRIAPAPLLSVIHFWTLCKYQLKKLLRHHE